MFIKYAGIDDQHDLVASCDGRLSTLLGEHDIIKAAKSSVVTHDIWQKHKPDDRHFGVHLVAFGCTPHYICNRNADAHDIADTRKNVGTFVTHGKVYDSHKHNVPKGKIKFAALNENMHRAELIVHVDKDAMPDAYEMAKAGKELAWSMGCKVAGDLSECCNEFARGSENHCEHIQKKKRQYIPERRKYAFVWNPNARFFDMSRVKKPAAHIAFYLSYRLPDGSKVASVEDAAGDNHIDQVKLASAFNGDYLGKYTATAEKLRQIEEDLITAMSGAGDIHLQRMVDVQTKTAQVVTALDESDIDTMRELRPDSLFQKLADAQVMLPPSAFYALVLNRSLRDVNADSLVKEACALSPYCVDLVKRYEFGEHDVAKFSGDNSTRDPNEDHRLQAVIDKLREHHSIDLDVEIGRVQKCATADVIKCAGIRANSKPSIIDTPANSLAATYGLYVIANSHRTCHIGRSILSAAKKCTIWC